MPWAYLILAITSEVIATSALKATDGFTRWQPSLLVLAGYSSATYFLSLTLKVIPIGVAYALWSGIGVTLITLVGWVIYNQKLDTPAMLGIGFIVTGVIILNVFSKSIIH
ncbi:MAG: multidrug efflux SMR transporter [Chlorobium sp.]|nr:MAG: multidrug efflux SMR transporter [Chlorobium sp.]